MRPIAEDGPAGAVAETMSNNVAETMSNASSRMSSHTGNESRGGSSSTLGGSSAHPEWTVEERTAHVRSLGLAQLPEEDSVERFLEDSLAGAPLPAPWIAVRDESGRLYFSNTTTMESSWHHPCENSLPDLASVCRRWMVMPEAKREQWIRQVHAEWTAEAERQMMKWTVVVHESGQRYYYHSDTKETMWDNPKKVVLPPFYVKLASIWRLTDADYSDSLLRLGSQAPPLQRPHLRSSRSSSPLQPVRTSVQQRRSASPPVGPPLDGNRATPPRTPSPLVPGGKPSHDEWTEEERANHVASLGLTHLPAEASVQRFLEDALSGAPLPDPWITNRDERGRLYFSNTATMASSWHHPVEHVLPELGDVCRSWLAMHEADRDSWVRKLHTNWTAEAEKQIQKWKAVADRTGQTYYYHADTKETMWENPKKVCLPQYYVKLQAVWRLTEAHYVDALLREGQPAPPQLPAVYSGSQARHLSPEATHSGSRASFTVTTKHGRVMALPPPPPPPTGARAPQGNPAMGQTPNLTAGMRPGISMSTRPQASVGSIPPVRTSTTRPQPVSNRLLGVGNGAQQQPANALSTPQIRPPPLEPINQTDLVALARKAGVPIDTDTAAALYNTAAKLQPTLPVVTEVDGAEADAAAGAEVPHELGFPEAPPPALPPDDLATEGSNGRWQNLPGVCMGATLT